ncbi:p-loop containing nucleoside triphosphate hydrolase protein [Mycena sanguinolenta]|uniref:p-loop containing nucleoside triphosphate hydrolase protein n=1 Tax=Mycena sanguinolenta TaxID=230812 RepID=A0A8H7CIF1_9AGAR|nr:p-loop containing nucleoside triphosphate hydrolase protein [Mycena sanguinolenta]
MWVPLPRSRPRQLRWPTFTPASLHLHLAPPLQPPGHALPPGDAQTQAIESDSDSEPDDSGTEEATAALEKRRAAYRKDKAQVVTRKKAKKDGNELSPEMDDMINAGSKHRSIKCFRVPSRLYFGSDKTASDHKQCRPDLPDGCPPLRRTAYFEQFGLVDLPVKDQAAPSRSRIPSSYEADALDMNLRDALHAFRRAATITKYSRAVLRDSGPGVVMSNEILERIVDCAHHFKIQSVEQLTRETRWAFASEFGMAVVDLIKEHRPWPEPPPAPETSTPLAPRNNNDETPTGRSIQVRKCSKCQASDHIASNRKCPFHPHHQSTSESALPAPVIPHHIDQNAIPPSTPFSELTPAPRPVPRPLYGRTFISYSPFAPTPNPNTPAFVSDTPRPSVLPPPATPMPALLPLYSKDFQTSIPRYLPLGSSLSFAPSSPFPSPQSPVPSSHFYAE